MVLSRLTTIVDSMDVDPSPGTADSLLATCLDLSSRFSMGEITQALTKAKESGGYAQVGDIWPVGDRRYVNSSAPLFVCINMELLQSAATLSFRLQ